MYPRNNDNPPRIAVGAIYLIATGAKVVADASVVVRAEGGDEGAGGGVAGSVGRQGRTACCREDGRDTEESCAEHDRD